MKKQLNKLRQKPPKNLDALFAEKHDQVFEEIDCLSCAKCCTSLGPKLNNQDIERVAKHLRMKSGEFFEKYLVVDDDGDTVFKKMPCVFLNSDNTCQIYDVRPKACREYPHTNHKNMYKHLKLAIKNMDTCPAIEPILQGVIKESKL